MHNISGWVRLLPIAIGFIVIAVVAARGCQEGPFGRSQIITITPEQELQLGREAYQQILAKERGRGAVVQSDPVVDSVREVGDRLRRAAEDPEVRRKLGIRSDLKLEWEFAVIRSEKINAFCLPGGKVAVYTGILPVCETEAGLAVVMGHEIGHALARHGAERMTQQQMVQIAQIAVVSSLGSLDPHKQMMVLAVLGAGAQVGYLLPFSREHEAEADHIGIVLMAYAGYDPREASRFWMRMSQKSGGRNGSEFLSTHPDPQRRSTDLERWAREEALAIYNSRPKAPNHDRPVIPRGGNSPPVKPPTTVRPPAKGEGWEIK